MKSLKFLPVFLLLLFASCSSVNVYSDFDNKVDFSTYKTFAFHKNGIDKVEISQLDKKRILNAIDRELTNKGMIKSENPDVLINIFTKEKDRVDVNQFNAGWGWGWGWNPFMWGGQNTIATTTTEGTLFIDLIDAKKKELIWQGEGVGNLTQNRGDKEQRINEFVTKILEQFPPKQK